MGASKSLNVKLPINMARMVKKKVSSGDYASESEVIRDGLRALQERDAAVERWLRTEGVARYDAYQANKSDGTSAKQAWKSLKVHMKKRASKTR